MSVASAACLKFSSCGKILALNIRYLVKNVLSVTILRRIYCEKWGNKGQKRFYFWIPKRNEGGDDNTYCITCIIR